MSDCDQITARLKSLQVPLTVHLWTPADAITFTPSVLTKTFGDGRALFAITTINNRPAHWIVRGDSGWAVEGDYDSPREAPDFGEFADDILGAIEEEFGEWPPSWAQQNAAGAWIDEETGDPVPETGMGFPAIDTRIGCSWSRLEWPSAIGLPLVANPFAPRNLMLADASEKKDGPSIF